MSDPVEVCLVATCHDPSGRFADGIDEMRDVIADVFGELAVNVTAETHPATVTALGSLPMPTALAFHRAGAIGIGTARKDALAVGLGFGRSERLFYSDLDHMLRWLSTSRDEVVACLTARDADLVVVGRSAAAMATAPARLRLTEELVNHVYAVADGLDTRWDLMIAMRLMTRGAAETIVAHSREASIANDVTWPMLVRARGGTLGYVEADGIRFLAREDFGRDADDRDDDVREWLERMRTATAHVAAIAEFDPA